MKIEYCVSNEDFYRGLREVSSIAKRRMSGIPVQSETPIPDIRPDTTSLLQKLVHYLIK